MSDRWQVVRIDEIERRDAWIPIRDALGIRAFGINAFVRDENDSVIGSHSEAGTGHQELYVVLDGHATFTVDGEEVDAPAGTLVFVGEPGSQRGATGEATVLAIGAKPGEPYAVLDWERAWRWNRDALRLYREERYAEAAEVLRDGLAVHPEHAGMHYNLACFASLAGEEDDAFSHLRRAVELHPQFRDAAREDTDFDPVRGDPRFEEALA